MTSKFRVSSKGIYKSHMIHCYSVAGVSMPEQNQDWEADSDAIVSGWGTLSSGGSSPDTLHAVTVPVVSDECKLKRRRKNYYDK